MRDSGLPRTPSLPTCELISRFLLEHGQTQIERQTDSQTVWKPYPRGHADSVRCGRVMKSGQRAVNETHSVGYWKALAKTVVNGCAALHADVFVDSGKNRQCRVDEFQVIRVGHSPPPTSSEGSCLRRHNVLTGICLEGAVAWEEGQCPNTDKNTPQNTLIPVQMDLILCCTHHDIELKFRHNTNPVQITPKSSLIPCFKSNTGRIS